VLLAATGCRGIEEAETPLIPDAVTPGHAAARPAQAAPIRLTDVAAEAGVRFVHEVGPQRPLPIVATMGSGAAFLDYDGDGRQDLFLVSSGQDFEAERQRSGSRLFRNETEPAQAGPPRFTDVTGQSGVDLDFFAMGCCTGDYDNDGDLDLFVSGYGRKALLQNDAAPGGGRRFRDVTRAAGLTHRPGHWSTGCAFADLNADGWLDLYVAHYVRYNPALPLCRTATVMSGCTPSHYRTQINELYVSNGDGTFQERAVAAGADDPEGAGLGVVPADFDNDGRLDLFIANDGTPNALLHNLTPPGAALPRFKNIGLAAGVAYAESGVMRAGMGTDAGDVDGDGRLDLVITNFQHEPNSLYRNVNGRFFSEVTFPSGIGSPSILKLGFGVSFADFDGDGLLDLYVGNGHVFDNVHEFDDTAAYAQTDLLFLNQRRTDAEDAGGTPRFEDVSARAGEALSVAGVARGLAVGDVDGDGIPDLLINRSGQPARLLRTERLSPRAWIGFSLRGTRANRAAIGARVEVRTPEGLQVREVRSGGSYLSQSDLRPLFGLGDVDRPEQVQVAIRWPGGARQKVPLSALNRYVTVTEQ
jgi:hypothetical protein